MIIHPSTYSCIDRHTDGSGFWIRSIKAIYLLIIFNVNNRINSFLNHHHKFGCVMTTNTHHTEYLCIALGIDGLGLSPSNKKYNNRELFHTTLWTFVLFCWLLLLLLFHFSVCSCDAIEFCSAHRLISFGLARIGFIKYVHCTHGISHEFNDIFKPIQP